MLLAVEIPDFWAGAFCGVLITFLAFWLLAVWQGRTPK